MRSIMTLRKIIGVAIISFLISAIPVYIFLAEAEENLVPIEPMEIPEEAEETPSPPESTPDVNAEEAPPSLAQAMEKLKPEEQLTSALPEDPPQPSTADAATNIVKDGLGPVDKATELLEKTTQVQDINRINEENMMLKKVATEIEKPLTGVEEIIRQEKMRMLMHRINRNIETIEQIRRDQQRQIEMQRNQRQMIQHQKALSQQ